MRVLFITPNRIGDAVLTTGVLAWLSEKYPTAQFTIVCSQLTQDLFRAVPQLESIVVLRKKPWNLHWLWLWNKCKNNKWDIIADFRNSIVSRIISAKKRAYPPTTKTGKHKVIDNAAAFNISPPPSPKIWTDDAAEKAALNLLPPGPPVIALGPAANWPPKQWPVEKFIRLAQSLTAPTGALPGARILVAAAQQERELIKPLLESFPLGQIIDTIGQDLLTVAACLGHCRLFIGNDSGLMHIAAAMGIPVLGLFGPGYEKIYGPWGPKVAVVRTPESTEDLLSFLPRPGAHYPNLMDTLGVDKVVEAAKMLLLQE